MNDQAKLHDMSLPLSAALREIQVLLKWEAQYWYKSDVSKVADKINMYDVSIEMLVRFIRTSAIVAFILVFQKRQISVKGIRSCFWTGKGRNQGDVRLRRNKAFRLLKNACSKIIALLQMDKIEQMAKNTKLNVKQALGFFSAQAKECDSNQEEANDDPVLNYFT